MSAHPILDEQCFFARCRYWAALNIVFQGKVVKVCKKHYKMYNTSHEAEQKRG